MHELCFEDFTEGQTHRFGDYQVTREEIVQFASEFDPQPFHLDDDAARRTPLGGLAASGWHTASMCMRMIFEEMLVRSRALGAPGVDEVRWLQPVRPGDRLHIESQVTAVRASASRPAMGLVTFEFATFNQAGVCVMTQKNSVMFGRRDAGSPA